tara:strand:+ start:2732 stop:3364 length:633 start_codon:yes stop_codon:yes gene_type:complete
MFSPQSLFIKEACVETLEQATRAEANGANRIELCSRLDLDGLTPSHQLITEIKSILNIPIRVMIRPREGDFCYSNADFSIMQADIEFCKKIKVDGVVFGASHPDKTLDIAAIRMLAQWAYPLKVTIHKAIDDTPDILKAVKDLIHIPEITGILSSGGAKTAPEGSKTLLNMLKIAGDDIEIVAAGKITGYHVEELHRILNARAYHGRSIV